MPQRHMGKGPNQSVKRRRLPTSIRRRKCVDVRVLRPVTLTEKWSDSKAIATPARPHYFLRSESNLFPFGNSTHSLINRSITSVSNTHVTTVTCRLHARRTRPSGHPLQESLGKLFRIVFPLRQQRNWWSQGESNPYLQLAKLPYCRYTDGPERDAYILRCTIKQHGCFPPLV